MYPLNHQETGTGSLVNFCKRSRVKRCRIPIAKYFLIPGFGWMTVFLEVIFIGRCTFYVKFTCIPVAAFACRLWTKMNPNTKLRLAKPCRFAGIIFLYGFPGWFKRPGCN